MLNVLSEEYDYIILDTAPVGLVTDTLQLARYANVCCYVCRADYSPKTNLALLNSLSDENKLPNACVVLNGVDMSKKKYGYYYGRPVWKIWPLWLWQTRLLWQLWQLRQLRDFPLWRQE